MTALDGRYSPTRDEQQAAYFCAELHREIAELDGEIARLSVAVDRQSSVAALSHFVDTSREELGTATAQRSKLRAMLAALGHPYPCSHSVKETLIFP